MEGFSHGVRVATKQKGYEVSRWIQQRSSSGLWTMASTVLEGDPWGFHAHLMNIADFLKRQRVLF